MLREVYNVNEEGFILDNYVGEFDEEDNFVGLEGNLSVPEGELVTEPLPQPLFFFKPRWNGSEWEEGESEEAQSERASEDVLKALQPSPAELADAQLEIKILNLLTDLEVV